LFVTNASLYFLLAGVAFEFDSFVFG